MALTCTAKDFVAMGKTARVGIGMDKPGPGETWADAAANAIVEGKGPLLARFTYYHIARDRKILDFGCGPHALQVRALHQFGFDIDGYEWPPDDDSARAKLYWESVAEGYVDQDALSKRYATILTSNVLNVQPTWRCLWSTLKTIGGLMSLESNLFVNLANEPRIIWENGKRGDRQLEAILAEAFDTVDRHEKSVPGSSAPVWECRGWRGLSDDEMIATTLDLLAEGILTRQGGL